MDTLISRAAVLANVVAFLIFVLLIRDMHPQQATDYLTAVGLLALPLLNLLALTLGPDREERRLRRAVNKAELRARLKALGEN